MEKNDYDIRHIGVLDGIRAVSILIVVWFHFWQQNWISPGSLEWLPRYGYLFVDMMILLSSFCLFLPYAREKIYGEKAASNKEFYKKRIARIAPSYYICNFIVLLIFVIPYGKYTSIAQGIWDWIAHAFFVHNLFPETMLNSPLNNVLWTLAVEVQYYILFPFLAKAFIKKPGITYASMISVRTS